VALRDERADERLVAALGDHQDATRTPLHGGEVWRRVSSRPRIPRSRRHSWRARA
jgi:hypothetical protein